MLAKLGDPAGARAHAEQLLRYWGAMVRPVPEVAEARRALAAP